jgi:dihydrofolate reductase
VVVSSTLTEATWTNTTIISGGNLAADVARMKEQYQGDILVAGSATLVHALTGLGLVDEYRLIVHPIVLGQGKRLFSEDNAGTNLELVESRKAGPDVLLLIYRPAKAATE